MTDDADYPEVDREIPWPTSDGLTVIELAPGQRFAHPVRTGAYLYGPLTFDFYRHADGGVQVTITSGEER